MFCGVISFMLMSYVLPHSQLNLYDPWYTYASSVYGPATMATQRSPHSGLFATTTTVNTCTLGVGNITISHPA